MGTEAAQVPAERSGAACPGGAVTAGDLGVDRRRSQDLQGRTGASARFPEGNRAAQVPAQRSGAACPGGAVTAGDWGWTDEGRKTFRAAPERQRGFLHGNRSSAGAGAA